jgi:hypothetical protein
LDPLEKKALLDHLDHLVTKVRKAHKELRVNVELLDHLEKKVRKAHKEFKVHKVNVAQLDLLGLLVNLVQ